MSTDAIQIPSAALVPALPSNYGDRFVISVREYLQSNGFTRLGQINASILSEIAQRFHDKNAAVVKTKRKLASEDEWLKELEADPAMRGLDVRRELGKCQFWCKNNGVVCTRKRFSNWLLKAERTVTHTYDGASSRPVKVEQPKPALSIESPVAGWPLILRNEVAGIPEKDIEAWCGGDWADLPQQIRQLIVQSA